MQKKIDVRFVKKNNLGRGRSTHRNGPIAIETLVEWGQNDGAFRPKSTAPNKSDPAKVCVMSANTKNL